MIMDIQSEKLNFIQWFSGINNREIIETFQTLKKEKVAFPSA